MAQLKSADGYVLGVTPVSYQFASGDNIWDLNWLVIEMTATQRDRRWRAREPALLTWELVELCDWLEALAGGNAEPATFEGTEPWLEFEAVADGPRAVLRVHFRLAFDPEGRFEGIMWDLPLDADSLREFTTQLRLEATRFPVRPGPD